MSVETAGQDTSAANSGETGDGGGVKTTLFTQEQVNHYAAQAKRGALEGFFKEAGLESVLGVDDVKKLITDAGELAKLKDGQKSDVEKLTGQLGEATKKAERIPVLESDLLRARIAADAGLKSRYWKYIEGKTEDEITASVKAVLEDVGGKVDDGEGQPKPPQPAPQQGRGGGSPSKSMSAGAARYAETHKKES